MQDWKQCYEKSLYDLQAMLKFLKSDCSDTQQIYYHTLLMLNYASDCYFNQQFYDNLVLSCTVHISDQTNFIKKLQQHDAALLRLKPFEFGKALLENKFICQRHPNYVKEILEMAMQDPRTVMFIVHQMSQNQVKFTLKPIFQDLIGLTEISELLFKCFNHFYLETADADYVLQSVKMNLHLTCNLVKRYFKWQPQQCLKLVNELESYFKSNENISTEKNLLIVLLLTTKNSRLILTKPILAKVLFNSLEEQNPAFLARTLKYLRRYNHKGNECSYRIGYEGLDPEVANLMRLSLQIEQKLQDVIQETTTQEWLCALLKQVRRAFKREPFSFTQKFVIFFITHEFQRDSGILKNQEIWCFYKAAYRFFFHSLFEMGISNVHDFEGVFIDELGRGKLITRVGNMKNNARKLIPYFSQLIINHQTTILPIAKQFKKMFVVGRNLSLFYLNFIYEPQKSSKASRLPHKVEHHEQLELVFPSILREIISTQSVFRSYFEDLRQTLLRNVTSKSFANIKELEQLPQRYGLPRAQFCVLQRIHISVLQKLRKNDKTQFIFKRQQVENILSSLESGQSCLFEFSEYIYYHNIMKLDMSLPSSLSYLQPEDQVMYLALCDQIPGVDHEKWLDCLISNFDHMLEQTGYNRAAAELRVGQEEVEIRDAVGNVYYEITEKEMKSEEVNLVVRNQSALLIYFKLLHRLIEKSNKADLHLEELQSKLRQLFRLYSTEDAYIIQYWYYILLILKEIDEYTSDKSFSLFQKKAAIELESFTVPTKDFLIFLLIQLKDIRKHNILHILNLINQLKKDQQAYLLGHVFANIPDHHVNFEEFFFLRKNPTERLFTCKRLCEYLAGLRENKQLSQSQLQRLFLLTLEVFIETQDHRIQMMLVNAIAENLLSLGLDYLMVLLVGCFQCNEKVWGQCKRLLKEFQLGLYGADSPNLNFCNVINTLVYLLNGQTELNCMYQMIRKFFKSFMQEKSQKHKVQIKKQALIIQQFQQFLEEVAFFKPNEFVTIRLFKNARPSKHASPKALQDLYQKVSNFNQVLHIVQFVFIEVCNPNRKYIQERQKNSKLQTSCVDSRFFQLCPGSKEIKQKSKAVLASPAQFYSDNKGMEKVSKQMIIKQL